MAKEALPRGELPWFSVAATFRWARVCPECIDEAQAAPADWPKLPTTPFLDRETKRWRPPGLLPDGRAYIRSAADPRSDVHEALLPSLVTALFTTAPRSGVAVRAELVARMHAALAHPGTDCLWKAAGRLCA